MLRSRLRRKGKCFIIPLKIWIAFSNVRRTHGSKEGKGLGASPAVQLLGLGTPTAWDMASILGWGTKILQAMWHSIKKERKKES